jgi:hypothetical protein
MGDELTRRIAAAWDAKMTATMLGTSAVPAPELEPFNAAKLQRLIASMPPKETWLASVMFPVDSAYIIEASGEKFTVAHPAFFERLHAALLDHPAVSPAPWSHNFLGFNIEPVLIDLEPGDSDERTAWKKAHWRRLSEAFQVAMMPLPEWLRSPPKFGNHG